MARHRRPLTRSTNTFFSLARTRIRQGLALTATLLLTMSSFAQQTTPPPDSPNNSHAAAAPNPTPISVPAGTRIALVLTQPIQTRYLHRGDDIYAQITSPVTAGNQVAIPPGAFVQGKVDNLGHRGGRGELRLQSMSITFPDGYVAPITGPITLETDDGYVLKDPGSGRVFGAVALPVAGFGLGALIGHSAGSSQPNTITSSIPSGCSGPPPGCLSSSLTTPGSSAKSIAIGAAVGGAVGIVASLVVITHSHNFFLDAGSPAEMVLPHPLSLQQDQAAGTMSSAPGAD
jgi:hypothetical protein